MGASTFTVLFNQGRDGNRCALGLAYDIIGADLRRVAGRLLHYEFSCNTTQATDLVSEVFIRFHRLHCRVLSREHFLNLAARSMRQVLIDRGRRRSVRQRSELDLRATYTLVAEPESARGIAARHTWEKLHALDPKAAEAFWAMEVEGCTANEVAARQKRAAWRVTADCDFAREWIAARLN